jgi:ankyrin repeat protein/L-ascorbate metabolism protein UlaG (beta-lactamase superfamily)
MMKSMIRIYATVVVFAVVRLFGGQADDIFQKAQRGTVDEIRNLVAGDPSLLKAKSEEGDTLLHFAVGAGRKEIVEFLLSRGLDLEAKNDIGQTALLYAAYGGHLELVSFMIEKGACFQYQDQRGMSPLHFAAREGKKDVVSLLVKKGASPAVKNRDGRTPVELAILRGRSEVVIFFQDSGLLDLKSEWKELALHSFAAAGRRDLVDEFLKAGAVLSVKAPDGKTMIHSAAEGGLAGLVEKAVGLGLDVRARDEAGRTALYYAVRGDRADVANILLKNGADPNTDETEGRTLLHVAEDSGSDGLVAALKAAGAKERPRPEILLEKYPVGRPNVAADIAYIANEGFRVFSGKKTVLVDALVDNTYGYDNTPPAALERMVGKKPPYERIDLLLFSHAHADHFNAAMAVRVLEAHPECVLVGNEGVKSALAEEAGDKVAALSARIRIFNPAWGTSSEAEIGGIPLKIFPVNHADFPREYQTLAFLMNIGGLVLFHLGDSSAPSNRKFFEAFGLEKEGIDIAFLDPFFLQHPVGRDILPAFIRPDRIIPMHLRRSEIPTVGAELTQAFPNLVLYRDALEVKIFRKIGRT